MSYIVDERTGPCLTLFIFPGGRVLKSLNSARIYGPKPSIFLSYRTAADLVETGELKSVEPKAKAVAKPVVVVAKTGEQSQYEWRSAPEYIQQTVVGLCLDAGLHGRSMTMTVASAYMGFIQRRGHFQVMGERWLLKKFLSSGSKSCSVELISPKGQNLSVACELPDLLAAVASNSPAS